MPEFKVGDSVCLINYPDIKMQVQKISGINITVIWLNKDQFPMKAEYYAHDLVKYVSSKEQWDKYYNENQ